MTAVWLVSRDHLDIDPYYTSIPDQNVQGLRHVEGRVDESPSQYKARWPSRVFRVVLNDLRRVIADGHFQMLGPESTFPEYFRHSGWLEQVGASTEGFPDVIEIGSAHEPDSPVLLRQPEAVIDLSGDRNRYGELLLVRLQLPLQQHGHDFGVFEAHTKQDRIARHLGLGGIGVGRVKAERHRATNGGARNAELVDVELGDLRVRRKPLPFWVRACAAPVCRGNYRPLQGDPQATARVFGQPPDFMGRGALLGKAGFAPLPTLVARPRLAPRCLPPDPDCAGKAGARTTLNRVGF